MFNFLHLSIHEYLAAYHISSVDKCRQFTELKNTFFNEMYHGTWNMFIDMNKDKWLSLQNYCIYCEDPYYECMSKWIAHIGSSSIFEYFDELYNIINTNKISNNVVQILFCKSDRSSNNAANAYKKQMYLSFCNKNSLHQNKLDLFIIGEGVFSTPNVIRLPLINKFFNVCYANYFALLYGASEQQIVNCFKFNAPIICIILKHCHISETAVNAIQISNLWLFEVTSCTFEDNAPTNLASSLSSIPTLKNLIFCDIHFSTEEVDAVFSVLSHSNNLSTLDLSDNHLHSDMIKIAEALKYTSTLEKLNLTNSNISPSAATAISTVIKSQTSLREFSIGNNKLGSPIIAILKALCEFFSLQRLDLSGNHIPEEACEAIASVILNNTELEYLVLSDNSFGKGTLDIAKALQELYLLKVLELGNVNMPDEISEELALAIECNLFLNTVNLSDNDMQSSAVVILQALAKITSLRVLNLQSTKLNEDAGYYLSSVICNNTGLNQLYLDNNHIGEGLSQVARALQQLNSLQVLGLGNTNMPMKVYSDLASAIKCNTDLNTVQLNNNNLNSSAVIILQALSKISSLRILNLLSNQLTEDAGQYLSCVISNNPKLSKVVLGNNYLGIGVLNVEKALQGANIAKEELESGVECNQILSTSKLHGVKLQSSVVLVLQVLSKISSIKVLNLQSTHLNESAGSYLSSVICANTGINNLYLDNNDIGKGLLDIAKALQQLNALQVLSLGNTNMPKKVSNELEVAIECNQNLNTLKLYGNNLQTSVVVILQALSKISSLRVLDLYSNQLSEDVGEYLSSVIQNNHELNELNLNDNNIGPGVLHIVKSLKQLNTLHALNLGNTNMPKEACKDITLIIEQNPYFETLNLHGNNLQSSTIVILQALSKVSSLEVLNLHSNQLSEDVGEYISSAVSNNTRLNTLLF